MHSIIPYAATLLSISILSSCTCQRPSSESSSSSASDSAKLVIGTAIYKYDDTFMASVRNFMQSSASPTTQLNFVDCANQQPIQNEKIDLFITKKVQALAINPVDRSAAGVLIDKAKAANIPAVFFNREPFPEDMKKWDKLFYVGTRGEEAGEMQGQLIAEYWKAHPEADKNKDGKLQFVMLKGEPGHQDAELRTKHSVLAIEAAGIKVERLAEAVGMWDRIQGQEKMAAFLGAHGDKIEFVIANNDDMALGAIEALKSAGYFQNNKYMPVVGVDATVPAVKALQDGHLLGTVLNDAKNQGRVTVQLAELMAQGKVPSKEAIGFDITDQKYVWIPYKKITIENIKEAM